MTVLQRLQFLWASEDGFLPLLIPALKFALPWLAKGAMKLAHGGGGEILGKMSEGRAKGKQADYENENTRAELQRKLANDAMERYQTEQFAMPKARLGQVGRGGAIATMRPSTMPLPSWAGGGSYRTGINNITDQERASAQKYADLGSANLGNEHLPPSATLPTAPATPGGNSWLDNLLGYGGAGLSLLGALKPKNTGTPS